MSTRSYICVEQEDGTYQGVYCHSDGYLTHNGALLIDHYNSKEMADKILERGSLSYLAPKLDPDPDLPHSFDSDNRQEGVCIFYGRDRDEKDQEAHAVDLKKLNTDIWIEYVYVFTKDSEWKYFESGHLKKGLRSVKTDLDSEFKQMGIDRPEGVYGYYPPSEIERYKLEQGQKKKELEMG